MRVSKLFQLLGHSCRKAVLEDSWKFSGADFDTRQMSDRRRVPGDGVVSRVLASWLTSGACPCHSTLDPRPSQLMMPDPDIVEAKVAQDVLGLLDHAELFF